MKDNRPLRAVGINYFDAFLRVLDRTEDRGYVEGFAALRERDIPFVRFTPNGFWPSQWSLWRHDRARYFELLDAFVREAERQHIGLIPSFFWFFAAVPDLAGEPVDQWGNPHSKTHALMREYTTAIVERYRGSPAIWAWEFGNEHRLQVDLPGEKQGLPHAVPKLGTPATRGPRDKLDRTAVECAQREFGRLVRRLDPHRVIVTGDAMVRSCAFHLMTRKQWVRDTPAQTTAMILRDNPDPFDCLSIHLYPSRDEQFFDPPASLPDLLRVCQEAAVASGKPLFLGEFGVSDELGEAEMHRYMDQYLSTIVELQIPLSALWVYDLKSQNGTYNITPTNSRAWMLDAISAANRRLNSPATRQAGPG